MNVNIRAYFSSLALIVSLLSGEACAQQPLVKVGVCTIRQSPQLYIDLKTNLATGAYVDLMNAISKDRGMRVEFHPLLGGDTLPALNAKIVDMSVTGLNLTPQTGAQADFSEPVVTFGDAMIVKASDKKDYQSLEELKGETVAANAGTIYADMLGKSGLFTDVKVRRPAGLAAVRSGEVKAFFGSGCSRVQCGADSRPPGCRDLYSPTENQRSLWFPQRAAGAVEQHQSPSRQAEGRWNGQDNIGKVRLGLPR